LTDSKVDLTMTKLAFESVLVGQVVELDCLGHPTLFVKINGKNNCLNFSSWITGYISPSTLVTLIGKLALKEL
jgi:hypothetical protein